MTDPDVAATTRATLLAVRLRPGADAATLGTVLTSMASAVDDLDTLLGRLELAGLVEQRAQTKGWRLTDDGRAEGERLLGLELDGLGVRTAVTAAYDQFVFLNGRLLRACTDWQLRDATPSSLVVNDHDDPAYDAAVIERLGAIHEAVLPACAELAAGLHRLSGYGPRFTAAWDRIAAGDHDAFDKPDTDSYHAIWFELHDHLLATLGRDRSTEPLPGSAGSPM